MSRGQAFYDRQRQVAEDYKKVRATLLAIVECPQVEPQDRLRAAELIVRIDEAGGIIKDREVRP